MKKLFSLVAIISACVFALTACASIEKPVGNSTVSNFDSESKGSASGSYSYTTSELKSTLYQVAEQKVKSHIDSYQDVDFSGIGSCDFEKGDDGVYMMTGTVGTIPWGIMAEIVNDKWDVIMITIGDDVYYG